jgi:hypothetical protein
MYGSDEQYEIVEEHLHFDIGPDEIFNVIPVVPGVNLQLNNDFEEDGDQIAENAANDCENAE